MSSVLKFNYAGNEWTLIIVNVTHLEIVEFSKKTILWKLEKLGKFIFKKIFYSESVKLNELGM